MTISAVIPTLNRVDGLDEAVESIMNQSRLPDELIIVDQSVSSDSKERIGLRLADHDLVKKIIYIHDSSISGLVEAKHEAVCHSSGDIVMFLEDDVVLEPDYLEVLERGFVDEPEMLGCCGVVKEVSGSGNFYFFFFHLFHRGIFHDPRVGIHGIERAANQGLVNSDYLSGGLSAYRKEVFAKVPFDTKNGFFALEDIDFSTRAAKKFGKQHFFINTGAILDHRVSPVNRAKLLPKYERKVREFICFYKKNRTSIFDTFSLIWLMLGLLIEAVMSAIVYRSTDPLIGAFKGFVQGIRQRIERV